MKTLLVLRHGKSSWSDPGLSDRRRPLKKRGKRAAEAMGREVRERGLVPDLIISSHAKRAWSTSRRVQRTSGYAGEVLKRKGLYSTGVKRHLEVVIENAGADHRRVMIVGHNPDLEDLVHELTGQEVTLVTASLACIDLAIEAWEELPTAKGELRFVIRPSRP